MIEVVGIVSTDVVHGVASIVVGVVCGVGVIGVTSGIVDVGVVCVGIN